MQKVIDDINKVTKSGDFRGNGNEFEKTFTQILNSFTQLQENAEPIIKAMKGEADLTDGQTEGLIEQYLKDKDLLTAGILQKMYTEQPEKVYPFVPRILESFKKDGQDPLPLMPLMMSLDLAKTHPELVTPEMIKAVASFSTDQRFCLFSMQFLEAMTTTKFNDVVECETDVINAFRSSDIGIMGASTVLLRLSDTEDRQRRYLKIFADRLNTTQGPLQNTLLSNMRQIGSYCPKLLAEYRPLILQLHSRPDLRDMCQATLDVIDERSLETVSNAVIDQKNDIMELDDRMTYSEGEISNVKVEVGKNREDINFIKTDVDEQNTALKNVTTEMVGHSREINELGSRVTNNEVEINNVQVEVGKTRVDIDVVRTDVDDQNIKLKNVTTEMVGHSREINELGSRVTNNEVEVNNVQVEVGKTRVDIDVVRTDVDDQNIKLEKVSNDIFGQRNDINQLDDRMTNNEGET